MVSLNAGDDLRNTVSSILEQTYDDFEIIVKDGFSKDGSIEKLPEDNRIRVYQKSDIGIYDAMNQAIDYVSGDFVIYMNCGDMFYSNTVLEDIAAAIDDKDDYIYYGDCFTANRNYILKYPDTFNDYVCFTKVLCHQATIYSKKLLEQRRFNLKYKIAADCEYYVNAYKKGVRIKHLPIVIATYQGNGASESTKNIKLAIEEKKRILKENFSKKDYTKAWIKTQLRGVGIKQFLVQRKTFYKIYSKLAKIYYKYIE